MAHKQPGGVTESHIRIPLAVLNSPAFCALSLTARALLLDVAAQLRSTNNGNLNAALSQLRHRGWGKSPATLTKALRELEALGFIRVTRDTVGVQNGSKQCKLYRVTYMDAFEFPKLHVEAAKASHEYNAFTSLHEAQRVARAAREKKRRYLKESVTLSIRKRQPQITLSIRK